MYAHVYKIILLNMGFLFFYFFIFFFSLKSTFVFVTIW